MKYTVPKIENGRFKVPAYQDLFAGVSLTTLSRTETTITFETHTGPPLFEPCLAPGHDELLKKPDVVVEE